MDFILYSDIGDEGVQNHLGVPDYSYVFVFKAFRDALQKTHNVHCVANRQEVVETHQALTAQQKTSVTLLFVPPHRALLDLPGQTLCVLAWEYDSIPDVAWADNPCDDWRHVFAQHGGVITLSQHSAAAVRAAMGETFPVLALPAPIWEQYRYPEPVAATPVIAPTRLEFVGCVIDSALLGLSADGLIAPILEEPQAIAPEPEPEPMSEPMPEPMPEPEPEPAQPLTDALAPLEQRLSMRERSQRSKLYLHQWYQDVVSDLVPASVKSFVGKLREPAPAPQSAVAELQVEPALDEPAASVEAPIEEHPQAVLPCTDQLVATAVQGVVYASVFNPNDGRKNWIQLVTAFCWAFKDVEDATLLLKINQRDLSLYYAQMLTVLSQLSPFKCRVVVLHGFLDDEQFARVHAASSYYVNFSLGEGLCLPLMEFMARGKPVLAPNHTAMADYIDSQVGWVIPAGHEHTAWPQDLRLRYSCLRFRPDWGALVEAYRDSYRVAKEQPEHYAALSQAAQQRLENYAGTEAFLSRLQAFCGYAEDESKEQAVC